MAIVAAAAVVAGCGDDPKTTGPGSPAAAVDAFRADYAAHRDRRACAYVSSHAGLLIGTNTRGPHGRQPLLTALLRAQRRGCTAQLAVFRSHAAAGVPRRLAQGRTTHVVIDRQRASAQSGGERWYLRREDGRWKIAELSPLLGQPATP